MAISLTYCGRATFDRTGVAVNTATAVSIGAADSTRAVAVFVVINDGTGGNATASSVTIGGVSATYYASHSPGTYVRGELWWALVPSGTTADIVLTLSASNVTIAELETYAMTGGAAIAPQSSQSVAAAYGSFSVDVPAGGAALCCAIIGDTQWGQAANPWGWTGATKDVEADAGDFESHSSASLTTATALTAYSIAFTNAEGYFAYANLAVVFESGGDPGSIGSVNGSAAVSASGAGPSNRLLIDFGAAPGTNIASAAVTGQTGIVSGSAVEAWIMANDSTADHNAYEHALMPQAVKLTATSITAGTGFTITAVTMLRLTGRIACRWVWH
jgi:hypothetical protein